MEFIKRGDTVQYLFSILGLLTAVKWINAMKFLWLKQAQILLVVTKYEMTIFPNVLRKLHPE